MVNGSCSCCCSSTKYVPWSRTGANTTVLWYTIELRSSRGLPVLYQHSSDSTAAAAVVAAVNGVQLGPLGAVQRWYCAAVQSRFRTFASGDRHRPAEWDPYSNKAQYRSTSGTSGTSSSIKRSSTAAVAAVAPRLTVQRRAAGPSSWCPARVLCCCSKLVFVHGTHY